jgi:hypothetical protein
MKGEQQMIGDVARAHEMKKELMMPNNTDRSSEGGPES